MPARSLIAAALALSCALASACNASPEQPPPPAPKPNGAKGLSVAALAELRTPNAWVPTPFLDGLLTVALPPMLRKAPLPAVPPGSKLEAASVVSMRNDNDTLSFVVNRGGHLREADVGAVCQGMSTADMGGTGSIIAREMLTTHATPICKLHSVSSGYLTMQRLVSIEGRGTHIAVTLADDSDDATKLAAEKILGTIQLKLTEEGSPCAAGTAAKCADDRRMLSCKDGRWSVMYCNAACEAQGGPGDGCVWSSERNAPLCMCGDAPR
jgi:hypothetical protein